MAFWCYMLHCRAGRFYVGHTDDLERRVAQHQSGAFRGFTNALRPIELVWSQDFQTRYEALEAEDRVKGWSRKKKLALIRGDWNEISRLAKSKNGPSTSSGQTELEVHEGVFAFLVDHTSQAHPEEACGILLGSTERITHATTCANIHPTPSTHFEIDPAMLIAAHRAARAGGPHLAGYWHSHPTGSAAPSPTDQACASGDGKVWAIVAGSEVRFWRDGAGGFEPLPYRVVDG